MDLTRDVIFRGFYLNNSAVHTDLAAEQAIAGCILDSADFSDADVTQFIEKRSQMDGMDAGDVWLGARRLRLGGTLYGADRADLYDRLWLLRAALSPVLAQREEPGDRGYRPLYFSTPTNDPDYDADGGLIELMIKVLPRAFSASILRDMQGGEDVDALAIPWQATFVAKDPSIFAAEPLDTTLTGQTIITGATANAGTNLVTKASHGLVAGNAIRFTTLTAGTGLSTSTTYYVIASGLTTGVFKVSTTLAGSEVDITVNYTDVAFVKSVTDSGTLNNRGTYICPVNALWYVGVKGGSISASVGDATFTITVPTSTYDRILRFKGEDKVFTLEEVAVGDPDTTVSAEVPRMDLLSFTNATDWPYIDPGPGQPYSFTTHGAVQSASSHFWIYERYA